MNQLLLDCFNAQDLNSKGCAAIESRIGAHVPSEISVGENLILIHDEDGWSDGSIQKLINEDWIQHNWQNEYEDSLHGIRKESCDCLASVNGPILEIAAGPGGGNFTVVLQRNPDSLVIVNDISKKVLELWKQFLCKTQDYPNVVLAAFDARPNVMKNTSIEAVSSMAGPCRGPWRR